MHISSEKIVSGILYHCIPVTPIGQYILPSDHYGAAIPENVCRELGIAFDEKAPLIFGATHITKALAFGLQGRLQEKIFNCAIDDTDEELVLCCDREKMMSRIRDITVYEIPSTHFVPLTSAERQCISATPVAFSNVKVAYRAKNAVDLMRAGLQILAFDEDMKALLGSSDLEKIESASTKDFYRILGDMVRNGKVVWENKAHNIKPSIALAEKMCVSLSLPNALKKGFRPFK